MHNKLLILGKMKSTYIVYSIAISFLASLFINYKKNKNLYIKVFPFFLLLSFFVEILGEIRNDKGHSNVLMYNIFTSFEFTFYIWMIREIVQNLKAKRFIFYI